MRRIKKRLSIIYRSVRWYSQFFLCKLLGMCNKDVKLISAETFENPLILVPHSDDEWIGPYSILKNSRENTTCLYFNLFGNNYTEKNKKIRNTEIEESSNFWGFKLRHIYNFNIETLSNYLKQHTCIFVPSPYDWHYEHRRVFQTLYEALSLMSNIEIAQKKIYYYSVSVPHRPQENLLYVPLTRKDVDKKWDVFQKIYRSQLFMPALRYKLNLRLVPSKCGYAAQFFILADINRLKSDYLKTLDETFVQNIDKLESAINDLYYIRRLLNKI